jgi:hypothetical protein
MYPHSQQPFSPGCSPYLLVVYGMGEFTDENHQVQDAYCIGVGQRRVHERRGNLLDGFTSAVMGPAAGEGTLMTKGDRMVALDGESF